jgi:hypothetical protein
LTNAQRDGSHKSWLIFPLLDPRASEANDGSWPLAVITMEDANDGSWPLAVVQFPDLFARTGDERGHSKAGVDDSCLEFILTRFRRPYPLEQNRVAA